MGASRSKVSGQAMTQDDEVDELQTYKVVLATNK